MKMQVSTDGGVTWVDADNVRVTYDEVDVPGEDSQGQVLFNFTEEGLITDIWVSREEHLDHNIATSSVMLADLVSDMVEEDS